MNLTKEPDVALKDSAEKRGFLTSSSIQAFLLVLSTILRVEKKKNLDFKKILNPLKDVDFTTGTYAEYRAGYPSIQGYARDLLNTINEKTRKNYHYRSIGQIRKKLEKERKEKESRKSVAKRK